MLPTYAGPLRDPGAQLLRVAPSASPLDARQFSTKICKLSVHRRERNRARVRCQDGSGRNLTNHLVYSRDLTITGNVPPSGVVLASRDSSRAFVYVEDTAGQRLDIYNLNGPLQTGALYPLLGTIALPDSANTGPGPHAPVTMTSSLDDGAVFISGDGKLLVVPVDP
jgi:hypothetical protein